MPAPEAAGPGSEGLVAAEFAGGEKCRKAAAPLREAILDSRALVLKRRSRDTKIYKLRNLRESGLAQKVPLCLGFDKMKSGFGEEKPGSEDEKPGFDVFWSVQKSRR